MTAGARACVDRREDWMGRIDLGLARGDALGAARRAELVDDLLAVEVDGALAGERPRPDDVEVGRVDRRGQGGQGRRRDVPSSAVAAAVWWTRPSRSITIVEPHGPSKHSPPRVVTVTSGPRDRQERRERRR